MTDQNTTTPSLGSQLASSLLRHAMTAGTGILVTTGVITNDQQQQLISIGAAVLLWVGASAWSYIQKRNLHR